MSKTPFLFPNILLSLLSFILFCSPLLVISLPLLSEQAILLRIKQQWGNQLPIQWSSTTSPCHWPGISCSRGESITGISLNSQNLDGEIPPSICDLKNLTLLDLRYNRITGAFPTFLYNCTKLQTLVLSLNYFVGKLPNDINKLSPNLQHLDLSTNSFIGDIPTSLAQLKELITLDLEFNLFNGTFPSELGNLKDLEELGLAYNPFSPVNLPKEFGMLNNLKFLLMTQCNLIGEIPKEFANLTSLEHLDLADNDLVGEIPSGLFLFKNLTNLYLYTNRLSGGIPSSIETLNLIELDLSENELTGIIPEDIGKLQELQVLNLFQNKFHGILPSRIISWKSLYTLDLSHNNLSGPLPVALGSLSGLNTLNLSHNQLSGQIPPELAQLTAVLNHVTLDLSFNSLSGKIPNAFDNWEFEKSFLNNTNMCSDKQISNLHRCSSSENKYLALFLVPGAIIFLMLLYFAFFKINMGRKEENSSEQQSWELKPFHRLDFTETMIVSGLTDNNMIGSGGSGKVYRIIVNDSCDKVAVKRIWTGTKVEDALEKQFLTEVEILGTIRHANIVKLLCCVSSAHVKLLVYEYMENHSLDKWLQTKKRANEASLMQSETSMSSPDDNIILDWPTRLRIAVGAAKGLCYLHTDCSPPIIHRDVKSSNILLDSEFNAKIADFGLAKMTVKTGEPHTASAVAGSFGYIAPEYWHTKRLNEKIDVYSFGVVLLELATGKDPRKGNEHLNLTDWSWQHCCDEHSIIDALDVDIKEPRFIEQMVKVFKLGLICTSKMPSSRPSMKQVLQLLNACSHYENHGRTPMVNEEGVY